MKRSEDALWACGRRCTLTYVTRGLTNVVEIQRVGVEVSNGRQDENGGAHVKHKIPEEIGDPVEERPNSRNDMQVLHLRVKNNEASFKCSSSEEKRIKLHALNYAV